ncbi:MAG: peptide chain release factor N(5)-glutamine methyltransferase [Candidatus Coatesbacteria bacterium]|nr:MAG: peptide chain release factor N(5)-glutamine methyltransferase [Candidatus Coatesbacteria bacterium]
MTVGEFIAVAEKTLAEAGVQSPRADAETMTAAILNVRRSDLFLRSGDELPRPEAEKLRARVERRAGREPLQLILGYAPFLGLEVAIEPGVFVPRPETEGLAELCVELAGGMPNPTLVEACAGTAALSLAFLRERPDAEVLAVERDTAAVACAARTARRYGLDLKLVRGNLLEPLVRGKLEGTVDIVVANPPYIRSGDVDSLPPEVRDWEPREALDGGPDGLDYYPPLTRVAASLLAPGGWLAFEVGDGAAMAVVGIIELYGGFEMPATARDLSGVERYFYARKGSN